MTRLLDRWTAGDRSAVDELLPLVYQDLHDLASRYLRRERAGHTLPPTALVHEAYLRLVGSNPSNGTIENRVHFFAVAAQAMRRVLVDYARRRAAARRPPPVDRVPFDEAVAPAILGRDPVQEVLAVHESLDRLRENHPRQARVVELRYFGGLSEAEVGEVLELSRATVSRDWRIARLLLSRLLQGEAAR